MVTLFECTFCGREMTRALMVPLGDGYRCKSGDSCQRRTRARLRATQSDERG